MGETTEDITLNSDPDTISLREWIAKHADHLDHGIHEIRQAVDRLEATVKDMAGHVGEMHDELEAARPFIEKWQHSRIVKLAHGQMPWQQ